MEQANLNNFFFNWYGLIYLTVCADIMDSEVNTRLASLYDVENGTFGLEDFNYGSDALTNITFAHLKNTSFNGVTVCVYV